MKKTLLILLLSFGLSSCLTSEDIKSVSKNISNDNKKEQIKEEEVKDDGIEFVQWKCYKYNLIDKYEQHLLDIGYFIDIDELFPDMDVNLGMLVLQDTDTVVPVYYTLMGVKHSFMWGNRGKGSDTFFQIKIDTDGTGRFWDFTGVEKNETVPSSQHYDCKPPETMIVDKEDVEQLVEVHFK
jgi:hypothetical protein